MKITGILLVLIAMAVESLAQVCLKIGASGGPALLVEPYRAFAERTAMLKQSVVWKGLGVVFYGLEIFLWTSVLHLLDVSVAFPMGSLCFVGVALLSSIFLGEAVGRVRWLGVLSILAGTALLAV
ncbi:MAG: EamA family transporter [Cyanobacteria bacterium REEB67]|nr:EamA family transporter [Cyanobacteria bacterium REEB67]